jgi:hypothetical protein
LGRRLRVQTLTSKVLALSLAAKGDALADATGSVSIAHAMRTVLPKTSALDGFTTRAHNVLLYHDFPPPFVNKWVWSEDSKQLGGTFVVCGYKPVSAT